MSILTRKIVPLIHSPFGRLTLNVYEEAAITLYYFKKKKQDVSRIIPLYYPIKIVEPVPGMCLVVDINKRREGIVYRLKYRVPELEVLRDAVDKISDTKDLEKIRDYLKKYNRGLFSLHKELVLPRVIHNRSLLDEIETMLMNAEYGDGHGYIAGEFENYEEEKIVDDTKYFLQTLTSSSFEINEIRECIRNKSRILIEKIMEEQSRKHGLIDKSLVETRKIIEEKIKYLNTLMISDLRISEEKYQRIISDLRRRLYVIDSEIRRLRREAETFQTKHLDIEELIDKLEDERRRIIFEISSYEKKKRREMENIKKKYMSMINSEKKRLRIIDKEKENITHSALGRINKILSINKNIDYLIHKLNDNINSYLRKLERITFLTPPLGSSIYYVRSFIIEFNNGKRILLTPSKIYVGLTGKGFDLRPYPLFRRYILRNINLRSIYALIDSKYNDILKHDLLLQKTINDYEQIIVELSEKERIFEFLEPKILASSR